MPLEAEYTTRVNPGADQQRRQREMALTAPGAGIRNTGTMTITGTTINGNAAAANSTGGGISNTGTLTLNDSTVGAYNSAGTAGGIVNNVSLGMTNSTVTNNTATNFGGGRFSTPVSAGTATITRSTIARNIAISSAGGGVVNVGTLTLTNSTVYGGNSSNLDDGGIHWRCRRRDNHPNTQSPTTPPMLTPTAAAAAASSRAAGTVNLKNTIVAGNHDPGVR